MSQAHSAKIVIDNVYSRIVGFLPAEVHEELDKTLSYRLKNAWHHPKVKKKLWDGVFHLYYKNKGQSFYTGFLSFVREVLKKHDIHYVTEDRRVRPGQNLPDLEFNPPEEWGYDERDYQTFTIDRAYKFTRGILNVATGGGKTVIVTKLISEIKTAPFVFYVLTKDLMEQAHETLSACLNEEIGMIGDGKCDIKNINVCTIQTAVRALKGKAKFKLDDYRFDEDDKWDEKAIASHDKQESIKRMIIGAKGVYFDECHHVASKTCQDIMNASKDAYWRYGGTATPYREDGDEIMIQSVFGAKIVEISASYLIRKGVLVPPHILMVPVDSAADFHSYQGIYKNCISDNDELNEAVAKIANHFDEIGLSCLTLVRMVKHGKVLEKGIDGSEFVHGKAKNRKESIDKLRSGDLKNMIATTLADEGLDVPTLDSAILAGGGKSIVRIYQRVGRTLRKPKDREKLKSVVIIFEHNARFLKDHAKRVRSVLKKEPEFIIQDSMGLEYVCEEIDEILGIGDGPKNLFS
jgi:superfamily II DNA or RNA helicase